MNITYMIMKKNIFLIGFAALLFAACEAPIVEPESVFMTPEAAKSMIDTEGGRELTLNQLLDEYMTEVGNFYSVSTPYRTRSTNGKDGIYLFSIDTLPSVGQPLYIRGRVITEDAAGNFYKSMVIQQIVDGKQQALRLSVDASSVSGQFALGQEILIRINGLAIGRYANQPQLCVPSYNNNIYANKAEEKVGWAPGRIPFARFMKATTLVGTPDKSKIQVDTLTLEQIQDEIETEVASDRATTLARQAEIRRWDGKLVCIKNAYFTGEMESYGQAEPCTNGNPETDGDANVFAPTTNNMGYPQGRIISDGEEEILVSTSEYAKFARYYLPSDDYVGEVTGILGYYRDKAADAPDEWDWSITLRSLKFMGWGTEDDLKLFHQTTGAPWEPKEYGSK